MYEIQIHNGAPDFDKGWEFLLGAFDSFEEAQDFAIKESGHSMDDYGKTWRVCREDHDRDCDYCRDLGREDFHSDG